MTALEIVLGVACALVVLACVGLSVVYVIHVATLKNRLNEARDARHDSDVEAQRLRTDLQACRATPDRIGFRYHKLAPGDGGTVMELAQRVAVEMQNLNCSTGFIKAFMDRQVKDLREVAAKNQNGQVLCSAYRASASRFAKEVVDFALRGTDGVANGASTSKLEVAATALWAAIVDAGCDTRTGNMDPAKFEAVLTKVRGAICPTGGFEAA